MGSIAERPFLSVYRKTASFTQQHSADDGLSTEYQHVVRSL